MAGLINEWQAVIDGQKSKQSTLPDWLNERKTQALSQLQQMATPNRKMETWRYADASRLLSQAVNSEQSDDADSINFEEIEADCCVVIAQNGIKVVGEQPEWLSVTTLDQAQAEQFLTVEANSMPEEQAGLQLNHALMNQGCVIEVRANVDAQDLVIAIVYDIENGTSTDWQFIQNHIHIGNNSHVQIKEVAAGGRLNVVNAWSVGRDAEVKRQAFSDLSEESILWAFNHFDLKQNASVLGMNHRSGGSLQHHNQQVVFDSERATFKAGSINKTLNNSNITDIVNVFHNQEHNECEVIHRSIADGASQIFNNAKAFVAHGADHSTIEQDLKNILLSEDAKIFSKPELEVNTDEVVAAHGSTIGALDEQALFYLQSRGVTLEQARDIMIESFIAEAEIC